VSPCAYTIDEAYESLLFHGDDLRGIDCIEGVAPEGLVGIAKTAPAAAAWIREPLRAHWFADPLVLDASFQMAILWSFAAHETGSLPCFAGSYRQFVRSFAPGPVRVALRVTRDSGSVARMDIDYLDARGRVVAQMRDYECVLDGGLRSAFRRNTLLPAAQ
jgi:hypothetical protein